MKIKTISIANSFIDINRKHFRTTPLNSQTLKTLVNLTKFRLHERNKKISFTGIIEVIMIE